MGACLSEFGTGLALQEQSQLLTSEAQYCLSAQRCCFTRIPNSYQAFSDRLLAVTGEDLAHVSSRAFRCRPPPRPITSEQPDGPFETHIAQAGRQPQDNELGSRSGLGSRVSSHAHNEPSVRDRPARPTASFSDGWDPFAGD